MGASASVSLCGDSSSVKILRSTAKVSPEPACTLITEPVHSCVFGVGLETLKEDGQMVCGIPAVLKDMVEYLINNGLQHRGLFRLCGSVVRMRTLRQRWDRGESVDLQDDGDVPTVASLVKLFFRELPVPIVPEPLRRQLIHSLDGNADDSLTNQSLKENLHNLTADNLVILSYLINFLSRVATHNQLNHMPMENLATIFGPCIFHVPAGPRMIEEQSASNALLLHLLKHHTTLFPNQTGQQKKSAVELPTTPPSTLSAPSHTLSHPGSSQSEQNNVQRLDVETASSTSSFTQATQMESQLNSPDLLELDSEESSDVSIPAPPSDRPEKDRAAEGDSVTPCPNAPGSGKKSPYNVSVANFMGDSSNANEDPANHKMSFTTSRQWEKSTNRQMDAKASVPSDMNSQNRTTQNHMESPRCFIEKKHSDTYRSPESPSLKLRALDAELGPSPSPAVPRAPEDLPAQQQPFTCEEKQLPLPFHLPPSLDRNTVKSTQSVNATSPTSPESSPVCTASPVSANATDTSPLLSHITTSDCPVPSPRCSNISHSLRFNLDPDTAPSPPSTQEVRMMRSNVLAEADEGGLSITMLNRHIHYLRKRIRRFEKCFEQERRYKPAHNDKTANPEVARLMKELIKSRKQLKELKLKQSIKVQGDVNQLQHLCKPSRDQEGSALGGSELQQLSHNGNAQPNVEDTVNIITNKLKERRRELELPESLMEMSHFQIALEKTCLQKCLLYYEGLHGRPSTRKERTLMRALYDRYRTVKQLQNSSSASTVISTIDEEEGSDMDNHKPTSPRPLPQWVLPRTLSSDKSLLELSETPLVSPLDEANGLQPQLITMATLHEASRAELLNHLKMARAEKRRIHQALREFEEHFLSQTGRVCQKEDRGPMAEEYCQYKNLKAKLRLLEALLSKQQDLSCSS